MVGTAGILGTSPSTSRSQSQTRLIARIHFLKLTAQPQFSDSDKEREPLGSQRRERGVAGRKRGQPAGSAQGTRLPPPVGTLKLRQELNEMGIRVVRGKT